MRALSGTMMLRLTWGSAGLPFSRKTGSPDEWAEEQIKVLERRLALGEIDEAKGLYDQKQTPDTFLTEIAYQGDQGNLNEGVKVLVFFETWCPFSQIYVPRIEAVHEQYSDLGVDVIGWTQVSKSSSDDRVKGFILDNQVSFSVLKDNGRPFNFFDATAVPHTVVLHEGEIIWQASGAIRETGRVVEGIAYAK